ncbi:MAG: hypothetical protein OXC29_07970 [Rhodococcus sp.]|nr:hypothetical protein [Rhodococcus sp. (in: high G+C Gram-positive bacteria)]
MATTAAVQNPTRSRARTMSLSEYVAEHQAQRVFPPTSERAARMAMLIMFALMAVTLVVLVLDEAGIFG